MSTLAGTGRTEHDQTHGGVPVWLGDWVSKCLGYWNAYQTPKHSDTKTHLLFQQSLVISHHQVAIDLLHQVEADADGDQQAGAAVETGQTTGISIVDEMIVGMMATTAKNPAPT